MAASLLVLSCADVSLPSTGNAVSSESRIFPERLHVTAHGGGCGALELLALTLGQGSSRVELYASLKNTGTTLACSPVFSVELFDDAERSLGTSLGGLLVRHFYRLTDGSTTTAACLGPGDISMVAIADFPAELVLQDVQSLSYWCNFWALDALSIDGISIADVRAVPGANGVAYDGTLVNGFDVPLSAPSVAVFPLNRAGRPLGVARGRGAAELPAHGTWSFETSTVNESGVNQAAYPASGT